MNEKELHGLGVSKWDKLRDAIKKGDGKEALSLVDLLQDSTARLSNANIDWIDILLTTLAEEVGEDVIYRVVKLHDDRFRKRLWKGVNVEEFHSEAKKRLETLCDILTVAHGLNVDVSEDEEKFILEIPCDTGARLITRGDCGKTRRGYPWSHGEEGFCYYCSHCVVSWEMSIIESYGYPAWIPLPPRKPGEPCTILMYKNPKNIPAKYYRMLEIDKKES